MLVLTRRPGQAITIGKGVTITVVLVRNGKVKLGVEAPRSVTVLREELIDEHPEQDYRQSTQGGVL